MYGSIGWGVLMFIMGIVLDYSNVWPDAKCKMNPGERNYNVCFFMFSLMMFIAFIVATQIQFRFDSFYGTIKNLSDSGFQVHFLCEARDSPWQHSERSTRLPGEGERV